MIEKDLLLEIGKNKGIRNKEYIEKDYFQDVFLFNLFRRTNKFVFKGGTALYKLYKLPRFSEDLDFSVIEGFSPGEIENAVSEAVAQIKGFEVKSAKKTRGSILIKLRIDGILTKYNTLRIDVNTGNEIIRGFDVKNFISDFVDVAPFSLRALKPEEIIAEKIHSILMRRKARDLYDLFFLLRMSSFDRGLTEQKLEIFKMKFDINQIENRLESLKKLWEPELKSFVLTELFPFDIAKDFVAEKLKEK